VFLLSSVFSLLDKKTIGKLAKRLKRLFQSSCCLSSRLERKPQKLEISRLLKRKKDAWEEKVGRSRKEKPTSSFKFSSSKGFFIFKY